MIIWLKNVYYWIKNNTIVVGAAIGSLATIVLAILLRKKDDSATVILEHVQESNNNRKEKDDRALAILDKYAEDLTVVREKAEQAGEQLSAQQEKVLVDRLEQFSSADTEEQRIQIAEDLQEVFPFLNMVDPSEFGKVE